MLRNYKPIVLQFQPTAPYLFEQDPLPTNRNPHATPFVTQQDRTSHIKSQTQYRDSYPTRASHFEDNSQQRSSEQRALPNQEASPFKAAQLHLSETRDSDVSTGEEDKTISSRSDFSSHSEGGGENFGVIEKQQRDDLVTFFSEIFLLWVLRF